MNGEGLIIILMSNRVIEILFPKLVGKSYDIISPKTEEYNCIAFAADDKENWWWPDSFEQNYWPKGIPRDDSIESFQKAFQSIGYNSCQNPLNEDDCDIVALFVGPDNKVKHASKQVNVDTWKSKLGEIEDIEHSLADIEGDKYGHAKVFMSRPKP